MPSGLFHGPRGSEDSEVRSEPSAMNPRRGKYVALASMLVAVPVLFLALRKPVLEAWYLYRVGSENVTVASGAAAELAQMGCVRAIPRLLERYRGTDSDHAWIPPAFRRLSTPAAVPILLDLLRDGETADRIWALSALRVLGPASPKVLPAVAAALRSPDADVRESAALALDGFGPEAVPLLAGALDDPGRRVRLLAMESLEAFAPEIEPAVPGLKRCLAEDGGSSELRDAALVDLALAGVEVAPLLSALLGPSAPEGLHEWALERIAEVGPDAASAVPALAAILREGPSDLRRKAVEALAAIGPDAASAVPEILAWSLSPEGMGAEGRKAVCSAFERIGSRTVPPLIDVLRSASGEMREVAVEALYAVGTAASDAAPVLGSLLEKEGSAAPVYTLLALERMGPGAKPAIRGLMAALKGDRLQDAVVAAQALGNIGPEARDAVPELKRMFEDSIFPSTWIWASYALARIDPRDEEATSSLLSMLRASDAGTALLALEALGRLGPDPRVETSGLKDLLRDRKDLFAGEHAVRALSRLGAAGVAALAEAARDPLLQGRVLEGLMLKEGLNLDQLTGLLDEPGSVRYLAALAVVSRLERDAVWARPDLRSRLLEILLDGLADPSEKSPVPEKAMEALGRLGPDREAAAAIISRSAQDGPGRISEWIPEAIARLVPGTEMLEELLHSPGEEARVLGVVCLGELGPRAAGAVPALVRALRDPSPAVRTQAAQTLGAIGAPAKPALPALVELWRDEDGSVSDAALGARWEILRAKDQKSVRPCALRWWRQLHPTHSPRPPL